MLKCCLQYSHCEICHKAFYSEKYTYEASTAPSDKCSMELESTIIQYFNVTRKINKHVKKT